MACGAVLEILRIAIWEQDVAACVVSFHAFATIVEEKESADDEAAINKTVTVYFPDDDETETFRIVTSIRGNSLRGLISIDSPMGKALLHRRVGDTVYVKVNENAGYNVIIKEIGEAQDDTDDAIRQY